MTEIDLAALTIAEASARIDAGTFTPTALAEAAGIACENGVAVDEHARTSDPHVWAAGDCTSHPNIRYGRRIRLESVDNAFEQAKTATANTTAAAEGRLKAASCDRQWASNCSAPGESSFWLRSPPSKY